MLSIGHSLFRLNRELLEAKSEKISELLKQYPNADLSTILSNNTCIPTADPETLELIARFCHGYQVNLSAHNIISVLCLSHYLRMTESHCRNNLLNKARVYFEKKILPSWNETVESLRMLRSEDVYRQAVDIGVVDLCLDSMAEKVFDNPVLVFGSDVDMQYYLGVVSGDGGGKVWYRTNARRRLFGSEGNGGGTLRLVDKEVEAVEEGVDDVLPLSSLPVYVYESVINGLIQQGFPQNYVSASLIQYMYKWTSFVSLDMDKNEEEDDNQEIESRHRTLAKRRADIHVTKRSRRTRRGDHDSGKTDHQTQRQVLESIERLLPQTDQETSTTHLPCTLLCQILRFAISLQSTSQSQSSLELRIGKQLDKTTVQDLLLVSFLVPCSTPTNDIDRLKRILKCFYSNYCSPNPLGMINVAELMENFLTVIAGERELEMNHFIAYVELAKSALMARSVQVQEIDDGSKGDDGGGGGMEDGIYGAVDVYLDKHQELTEVEKEYVCKVLDFDKMSYEACNHAAQNRRLPLRVIIQVLFLTQLQLRDAISNERNKKGIVDDERGGQMINMEEEDEDQEMKLIPKMVKEKGSLWKQVKRKFGCMNNTTGYGRNSHTEKRQKVCSSSRKIISVLRCG